MADIYLARADTSLGGSRLCVVKQILPDLGRDGTFQKLLIEEAKLAAQLTHANVVQVFDLGREGDRLYLGMEYVEGFDLNQLLRALSKSKVPLPAEFALFMVREALRALDYAHRLKGPGGQPVGLVHRDVSPSNVLVSFEGEVKLCDFGIARAMTGRDESQASMPPMTASMVRGKSAYMAPEHARGEPIDARADVFAAGILLWELVAGRRLYKGTEEEMLALAKQAKIPPLPSRGLPDEARLQSVLDRALARFRDERYQSAAEFARALDDYAVATKLIASQLRFGAFLTAHFASAILALRRERELAARAMASDLPPAPTMVTAQPVDGPDDDFPIRVPASAIGQSRASLQTVRDGAARDLPNARSWNEPGSISPPEKPRGPGKIQLAEIGTGKAPSGSSLLSRNIPDSELERSLSGLDRLAQQTNDETALRSSAQSAPPVVATPYQEWLWYGAALLILGASALAYFLT